MSFEDHYIPSLSLIPVPICFTSESIKKKLPLMSYTTFLQQKTSNNNNSYKANNCCVCIVCMNQIEARHEVRVLSNCCHLFHGDCLDAWIDQGHGICPLCRSKLLPSRQEELGSPEQDPWRMERMIYLFGEDYVM
ncbi:hypothetical protein UlMin_024233 [Ulmus minor]